MRCLSVEALANAGQIFDAMKHKRMLPFNESARDPVRHELDRWFLKAVLGIRSEDVHAAVHRLREKLCLDKLSKWLVFIDSIDEEALEWLKLSVRYVTWDIRILVETLLIHASETPGEVAIIYLELSKSGIGDMLGSFLDQDKVIETVRILYEAGCTEAANQICIQFAEAGFDFLKPLYNEYQH